MSKTFKSWSKLDWSTVGSDHPTNEQLTVGLLQRIADSTEVMAQNYAAIIKAKNEAEIKAQRYYEYYQQEQNEVARLKRSNASLRGVITGMKNKGAKNDAAK